MTIPYGRQSISDADIEAVCDALRSDWLTTGPRVRGFEEAIQGLTGTPAVCVTSGTAALHVAYAAAGIGPGDEVITTPMTFVATAATAALLGATVVFADIEDDTACLDPEAAAAAVTSRTRVIAGVDYAGHPMDVEALSAVSRDAGALLLEDAAHAIGSTFKGMPVGGLADLTTFSFFPTKNMTTGEGGAVCAGDPELLARAARFKNHGLVRDQGFMRDPGEGGWHQEVHTLGLNYRLPDVLCALGISQLARLETFKRRRGEIFERYREGLADVAGLRLPAVRSGCDPMWHLYPVRVREGRRREVYDGLHARRIGVQVNYLPTHLHPVFRDLGFRRGQFPVAERFYDEELSLPMYPDLSNDQQDEVIQAIHDLLD